MTSKVVVSILLVPDRSRVSATRLSMRRTSTGGCSVGDTPMRACMWSPARWGGVTRRRPVSHDLRGLRTRRGGCTTEARAARTSRGSLVARIVTCHRTCQHRADRDWTGSALSGNHVYDSRNILDLVPIHATTERERTFPLPPCWDRGRGRWCGAPDHPRSPARVNKRSAERFAEVSRAGRR